MFQFATINVVSVLGNEQNVTKNIQRWPVDASNVRQLGVNAKHHDEQHPDMALHDAGVTQSLEELHQNGEDAVSLDPESFLYALEEHEFVFVDFFAGWCSHCQICKSSRVQSPDVLCSKPCIPVKGSLDAFSSHFLSYCFVFSFIFYTSAVAPTWEKFAEVMHDVEDTVEQPDTEDYTAEEYETAKRLQFPVLIAKVDCVAHHIFCMQQRVQGYPTLSLFVNGERYVCFVFVFIIVLSVGSLWSTVWMECPVRVSLRPVRLYSL
jgi:thiol-disulfide isomerase/thioredoxin